MTTATRNSLYDIQLVNLRTKKVSEYHLEPGENLADLIADAIDLDLDRAFTDGAPRAIVIKANPQRKH